MSFEGALIYASGHWLLVVPGAGFEPARLAPRNFKSLASTSFATRASRYENRAIISLDYSGKFSRIDTAMDTRG
jgi:hypothetical protein